MRAHGDLTKENCLVDGLQHDPALPINNARLRAAQGTAAAGGLATR